MVEAGTSKSSFSDISYAKFTPKRIENYRIQTVLKEKNDTSNALYIKYPSVSSAKAHLSNYAAIHQKLQKLGIPSVSVAPMCDGEGWYSEESVNRMTIHERLLNIWHQQGRRGVEAELDAIIGWMKQHSKWETLTDPIIPELSDLYPNGTHVIPLGLVDMNANNLLYEHGTGYVLIDQEWECEKQIPLDYAIMCSLGYLVTTSSVVRTVFTMEELFQRYEITSQKCDILKRISSEYYSKMIHLEDAQDSVFFQQLEQHSVQSDALKIEQLNAYLTEYHKENIRLTNEYNRVVKLLDETSGYLQQITGEYDNLVRKKAQIDVQLKELSFEYNRVVALVEEKDLQLQHIHSEYTRATELISDLSMQVKHLSEENNRVLKLYQDAQQTL